MFHLAQQVIYTWWEKLPKNQSEEVRKNVNTVFLY